MTPALAVEELRKDHEILRKDTAAFEATVRGLARSPEATGEALSGSLRARLAYFQAGMRLHFRREEEGLFPDVRRMVSEGARRADVIAQFFREEAEDDLSAHTVLVARMDEMIGALAEAEAAGRLGEQEGHQLRVQFGLFKSLLERHAAKEDNLIFPMVERALTPAQLDAVLDRLASIRPEEDLGDTSLRRADGLSAL